MSVLDRWLDSCATIAFLSLFSNSGQTAKTAKGQGFDSLFFCFFCFVYGLASAPAVLHHIRREYSFVAELSKIERREKDQWTKTLFLDICTLSQAYTLLFCSHVLSPVIAALCRDRNKKQIILYSFRKPIMLFPERSGLNTDPLFDLAWRRQTSFFFYFNFLCPALSFFLLLVLFHGHVAI